MLVTKKRALTNSVGKSIVSRGNKRISNAFINDIRKENSVNISMIIKVTLILMILGIANYKIQLN